MSSGVLPPLFPYFPILFIYRLHFHLTQLQDYYNPSGMVLSDQHVMQGSGQETVNSAGSAGGNATGQQMNGTGGGASGDNNHNHNPLTPPNSNPPPNSGQEQVSAEGKCIRTGCTQLAVRHSDWEDEYCSNECVITHCRCVTESDHRVHPSSLQSISLSLQNGALYIYFSFPPTLTKRQVLQLLINLSVSHSSSLAEMSLVIGCSRTTTATTANLQTCPW